MSPSAMSLKARIRNMAKEKNVSAQSLLQNYMFERFLDRLSRSAQRDNFVLKGGVLISAIVGVGNRSTMDLDTTLRGLSMSEENVRHALSAVLAVSIDDGAAFTLGTVAPIRKDDVYGGFRASLSATYGIIETPLSIDVSTGDAITPGAVRFFLPWMFDDEKKIGLWAYNIETVMAEKLETILSRNTLNTRPRDFYDVYVLATTQQFDAKLLSEAFCATAVHRRTAEQIADVQGLLHVISESRDLKGMWDKYQRQFNYAKGIGWEEIVRVLGEVCTRTGL